MQKALFMSLGRAGSTLMVSSGGSLTFRRQMGLVTRHWAKKRFYRQVSVYKEESGRGWYGVQLDHRILRTPLRKPFLVPTEALALAVSEEWQAQKDKVQTSLMHLTALCNTVLDEQDKRPRQQAVEALVGYAASDTLCFRVAEPEDLVMQQTKEWDPLIKWFNEQFSWNLAPSDSLLPVTPPPPPPPPNKNNNNTASLLPVFMTQLDRWAFAGFEQCAQSCKSLVLSCALFSGHINSQQASDLASLETRYQAERWGQVEWHHSVEETDLRSRLAAALLLKELS